MRILLLGRAILEGLGVYGMVNRRGVSEGRDRYETEVGGENFKSSAAMFLL